jgi:flagellar motor switch protein FliN/FliY
MSTAGIPKTHAVEKEAKKREPAVIDGELLRGVRIALEVRLGEAAMTVAEMLALKSGALVTLDTGLADHVELYLNDALVARGEIVAVGDKYGVRIIEIASAS